MPVEAPGFAELLRRRASERPDATAFRFLGDDGESSLTYAELDARARAIAAAIRAAGASGERVMIVHPPGLEFVAALFACFPAGAIAVPAYPPDPSRPHRTLSGLLAIVSDVRPALVLTVPALAGLLDEPLRRGGALRALADLPPDGDVPAVAAGAGDLALIQYTSGSTAAPRGVMVSHGNLLHNSSLIQRTFEHVAGSSAVVLAAAVPRHGPDRRCAAAALRGVSRCLMSPLTFLQRPVALAAGISQLPGDRQRRPELRLRPVRRQSRPSERAELDLEPGCRFNGAEPVARETLDASPALRGVRLRRGRSTPATAWPRPR